MNAEWGTYKEELNFAEERNAVDTVLEVIRAIRARRAEMNVPPSKKATLHIVTAQADAFRQSVGFIGRLAYSDQVNVLSEAPEGHETMVSVVTAHANTYIPLDQLIDLAQERERIAKEKEKVQKEISIYSGKLSNENFVSRAPEAVVNAERAKLEKAQALLAKLEEDEKRLAQ